MKLRITRRRALLLTGSLVLLSGATAGTTYAVAQSRGTAIHLPAGTCRATQPVYTDNTDQLVGTWVVTLKPGQEVFLPDSDVATCLRDGTLDVEQP
jgi:hypothetical protein